MSLSDKEFLQVVSCGHWTAGYCVDCSQRLETADESELHKDMEHTVLGIFEKWVN